MPDAGKWLERLDLIADGMMVFAWLRGEEGPARPARTGAEGNGKQRSVSVLQSIFGKADEGIWISLTARLKFPEELQALSKLEESFDRFHERDNFRLALVNAPVGTTTIEELDPTDKTKKKKIKKVVKIDEFSAKDPRVIFLKKIVKLVGDPDWGAERVRDMLRTQQLATESKTAKEALELWKGFLSWTERRLCAFFGVSALKDVSPKTIIRVLDTQAEQLSKGVDVLAAKIPVSTLAKKDRGFLGYLKRHYGYGLVMGICIVALAVYFSLSHFV